MPPLIENLPYPSLDGIKKDLRSANIIAPAYASLCVSETTASFQYMYHYFHFDALGMYDIGKVVEDIAIAEMIHIEILAKMLIKLGVDPIYSANPPCRNYYNTSRVAYSKTPEKMLLDDIDAEMSAIHDYQEMLAKLNNEQVAAVIHRILLDEKLHLAEFKLLLDKVIGKNNS